MTPDDLDTWAEKMRSLGIAHLRTPDGLELTLAPDAFLPIGEVSGAEESDLPERDKDLGPLGSRYLRPPRMPRYMDKG